MVPIPKDMPVASKMCILRHGQRFQLSAQKSSYFKGNDFERFYLLWLTNPDE